jgi:hypothetical protein
MEALEGLLPIIFGVFVFCIGWQLFVYYVLPYLVLAGLAAIAILVVYGIYHGREALARWYYFTFCPHPAEPAVRSALAHGRLLDGERLAAALGEAPPDNRILGEVRIAQGERLVAQMRHASEQTIRDTVKNAQADSASAAAIGIQEAIALAAVALERAKAAHAASKSIR